MKYLGDTIKKLGFGLMRLPMDDVNIDMAQVKQMVDYFMENGFTYFDTAYVYINGKSEVALKKAVVDRYPRDSFQAATKLPLHEPKTAEDLAPIFEESCKRAGLDFYDFYLLHAMSRDNYEKTKALGMWDYLKRLKAEGRIKHMGFSFHDSAELLDKILKEHPETEFVQLQLNYADWEDDNVQARKCYETARAHDKPIIVMEPVKGGSLASMTPEIQTVLKTADPQASIASWALRYAADLDGIITVLSGMSDLAQIKDNCEIMKDVKPLSVRERAVISQVVDILEKTPVIPCTSCKYCVDDCPQSIDIPEILGILNSLTLYDNLPGSKQHYGFATSRGGKASGCITCGSCESRCPQHIEIIEHLQKAASILE